MSNSIFLESIYETGTLSSTASNDDSVATLHLHRTHHKSPIATIEACDFQAMRLEDKMEKMNMENQKAKGTVSIIEFEQPLRTI